MQKEGMIRRLKNPGMYSVQTANPKVTLLLKGGTLLEWPVGSGKGIPVSKIFQKQEKERHAKDHETPDSSA